MDIHSHIYLLINDTAHNRTLQYWKVQRCAHVLFIIRYMCKCALKNKKNIICFLAESYKNKNKTKQKILFFSRRIIQNKNETKIYVLFLYDSVYLIMMNI